LTYRHERFVGLSPAMLEGLEQQELVCLDVHAIAGNAEGTRRVALFNRVREAGGRLLVSALRRAGHCSSVCRTGVAAGLGCDLCAVATGGRADGRGADTAHAGELELPEDTAQYLLGACRGLPSVFNLLDRLDRHP
jgi:hypothetical protein